MTPDEIQKYCDTEYFQTYSQTCRELRKKGDKKENDIETAAQKEAIKQATIAGMKRYPNVEASVIWRAVYETHIHRKSGIRDINIITKVIHADQSWKKSSGHAFEEMIKLLGTAALQNNGIAILLQRDLNLLIKANELDNEPRDISWLKEQIEAKIFDLYAVVHTNGKQFCFGCIQCKTSIRDRVTRDREPSIKAMQSFFWSTVIVLDGEYLINPKFISMVNGGTTEYTENGWHGMYVFSEQYKNDRIYPIDLDFKNFKTHAVHAANSWLTQRQWFNLQWRAD